VIVGLLAIMVYFAMTLFIERTTSMLQFHEKAVAGVVLYPIRDLVFFWCRWFTVSAPGSVVYPIKVAGGAAMFIALLLALIVFVQGARQEAVR
jgi:hypothetical protein